MAVSPLLTAERVRDLLREVKDPEVPVLDIVEMGLVRDVVLEGDDVRVDITPTYSGCPAMEVIESEVRATLAAHGISGATVRRVFAPAWTTDWMTDEAREKLRAYGIAPPAPGPAEPVAPLGFGPTVRAVSCPFCGSPDTVLESTFGSTACKSLHRCEACHQPFEHFKPH